MALISAWRRKPTCQLVSILDAVFALSMIALHSYILSATDRRPLELLRGLFDIDKHWSVYVLLWVTIYLVNLAQFVVAYLLYGSVKPDYPDPHLVQSRAQRWLRFASILFVLLLLKFILFMIYFVKNGTVDELSLLACLADIIWKMLTVYIVKRFVDDLRHQYPAQQPSVYFINFFSKQNAINV